ncbi:hypothetical protein BJY04DRAFT_60488 [Aspergillus karnatakaensis]|uniref:uncharacterized protein n=1 Tax=Aspergillus karnatakaensis TaxID=1810916 RepID=UPI003CCDA29F
MTIIQSNLPAIHHSKSASSTDSPKMQATAINEGHRTLGPSKWVNLPTSTRSRAFRNPGALCYRNAVILMLLHTPLLVNWIEEVHLKKHRCGTKMNLLCALHHLIGFYWFGEQEKDTYETCMDKVWKIMLGTTWSDVDLNERQDIQAFLEAVFKQLLREMRVDAVRHQELDQYFGVGLKTHLVCRDCEAESSVAHRSLFLNASFQEVNVRFAPSYEVAQAIHHHLRLGSLPWTCDKWARSNQHSNAAEPPLCTQYIDNLPEVLFVQVNHYGNQGQVTGKLELKETLIIPESLQDPDSSRKGDVQYKLYSIIFQGKVATDNTLNFCAFKGPAGKWALASNGGVVDFLTLDNLVDTADDQQPPCMLSYRRLPLNGQSMKLAKKPNIVSTTQNTDNPGIEVQKTLYIREGVEWTINHNLQLPPGVDRLIDLKGKARVERAKLHIILTSPATGEVLEGEANINLTPRKQPKAPKTPSKKRGRPAGALAAKPNGVTKKVPGASKLKMKSVPEFSSEGMENYMPVLGAPPRKEPVMQSPGNEDPVPSGHVEPERFEALEAPEHYGNEVITAGACESGRQSDPFAYAIPGSHS